MSLSDLLGVGHSPDTHEAAGSLSSLGSLMARPVTTVAPAPARMNLVQALRARDRGEIVEPTGGDGLGSMVVDAELPLKPAPAPEPDWRNEDWVVEARQRAAVNHVEMRHRVAAKKGISLEAAEEWMAQNG